MPRLVPLSALLLAIPAFILGAQDADWSLRPPRDSALARARALVTDGKAAAGRAVVDSVMKASESDAELHAEALFWRGVLAGTAADAERSYRRLLIEAPLSDRAEEAMLQLAQLEAARGNRRSASDHLFRYMMSYGASPERPARPRISLWLVRLLFEQPDQASRGCQAVQMSRDAIPPANVEMRNQLESYVTRCAYAQIAAPAGVPADTAAVADSVAPPADTTRASEVPRDTAPPRPRGRTPAPPARAPAAGQYSVQVAAYDSREAAANLVNLLVSRGLEARVDGTRPPYRVRVGRYATRAEAAKLQQSLKAQGQNGFITQVRP